MAVKIFPSVNDVAPTTGDGITIKEANLVSLLAAFINKAFVMSGLTVPGSSANLNLDVALGEAFIKGYWVKLDAATTVACTASSTNHIFLGLTKDGGGNVTGVTFTVNTTGTAPADSVKLATAVTSGSAVTSTSDVRVFNPAVFEDSYPINPTLSRSVRFSDMFELTATVPDPLGFGHNTSGSGSWSQQNYLCGAVELSTGTTINSLSYLWSGNVSGTFTISANEARLSCYCNMAQVGTTQRVVIVGWGDTNPGALVATNTAKGVFFRAQAAGAGVNIFCVTKNGASGSGLETTTDTGISANGPEYHLFEIIATSTSVKFYIDGNLVATHTTNIPTTGIGVRVGLATTDTSNKSIRVDWLRESLPGVRPT